MVLWLPFHFSVMASDFLGNSGIWCFALSYESNIHYYDGDLRYDRLKLVQRIKVCGMVMHLVCKQFNNGEQAYTPKQIHDLTEIPQQIVNQAVRELLHAKLLVEIRSEKKVVLKNL